MSAPVGPTGCEGSYESDTAKNWFASASYGLFASELQFNGTGNIQPEIFEQMVVAAAGRQIADAWSVRLAAGAIVDGMLSHDGRDHDVGTGWLVSASGARKWSFGQRFFATATLTLGFSSTSTVETGANETVSLTAADARLGALVGATLADRFAPYVLARAFGGPVSWQVDGQDIVGSDRHHYQLGVGASVRLPLNASALVDASFLGERSLSVGVSLAL